MFRRFFKLLAADKKDIGYIYIYAIFGGIVYLSLPLGIQAIINFINAGQVSTSWVILVIFVIVGIALGGVLHIMQMIIIELIQQRIFTRSAFEFAYRLPRIKFEATRKYYMPEMVNRFFDTLTVQKGMTKILIDFSTSMIQIFFGLVLLAFYNVFFLFFGVVLILLAFLVFRVTGPEGMRTNLKESTYKYQVAHWLEEVGRSMITFKLAGRTDFPLVRVNPIVSNYLKARKAHFRILVTQYASVVVFKTLIAALLLVAGSILVINEELNLGQFVAAEIIIILVITSVEKIVQNLDTVYDVLTGLEKIGYVTDMPLDTEEGRDLPAALVPSGLAIQARNLTRKYKDDTRFGVENINFKIESGEHVCIAGFNGSGKSTLLHLIAGLYDDYNGQLLYNDIPLGNLNPQSLHSYIGDNISFEDLFKGTIADNISIGRENITFEKMVEMSRQLDLYDYIKDLPNGFDTYLDPKGNRLPMNVVRKIILIRCLISEPRLVLLEEPFISLDPKEKAIMIDFIVNNKTPTTFITISNDAEFAMQCDRILVMERGQLIGDGTWEELKDKDWLNDVFNS